MTEREAKTKYCPIKLGPNLQTTLKKKELEILLENCLCVGRECPRWAWNDEDDVNKDYYEGYCR